MKLELFTVQFLSLRFSYSFYHERRQKAFFIFLTMKVMNDLDFLREFCLKIFYLNKIRNSIQTKPIGVHFSTNTLCDSKADFSSRTSHLDFLFSTRVSCHLLAFNDCICMACLQASVYKQFQYSTKVNYAVTYKITINSNFLLLSLPINSQV